MPRWQVVEMDLPGALEDPAAALLQELGSVGWESREAPGGRVRVLAYWRDAAPRGVREAIRERLRGLLPEHGAGARVSRASDVPEEDWEAGWRRHFRLERPLPDLVIRPSWIPYAPDPGETVLVIDPKMAFGVGSHSTTRLCLKLLREIRCAGTVLDVGTGTGVLAMAAARWGARRVVAVEMDGPSAENAAENVARNALGDRVEVVHGRAEALEESFDLAVANLLLSEIRGALAPMAARLRPGGAMILAGFLEDEAGVVGDALADVGLRVERLESEGEWGALLASRGTGGRSPRGY